MARWSAPFCSSEGRQEGLWYLAAGYRDTTHNCPLSAFYTIASVAFLTIYLLESKRGLEYVAAHFGHRTTGTPACLPRAPTHGASGIARVRATPEESPRGGERQVMANPTRPLQPQSIRSQTSPHHQRPQGSGMGRVLGGVLAGVIMTAATLWIALGTP